MPLHFRPYRIGENRAWYAGAGLGGRALGLWIGLLSGTSADGIDAALVRLGGAEVEFELVAALTLPLEEALRQRIHALARQPTALRDLVWLDVELGERLARAARAVADAAGVSLAEVEGIGSHGQTVGHFPEPEVRGTLQLGCAAVLHERTGVPIVSDFRRADLAAGGQGAPLTPLLHRLVFARAGESRAVLNIGGFTNVTGLPAGSGREIVGFDPGPGNALLDRAARWASGGDARFDAEGVRARRGRVISGVLRELLEDPYFHRSPPKSTGHEHFGAAFFERARDRILEGGGSPDDVLATLAALTVESVVEAVERFFPERPERWILYGGGARNPALREGLRRRIAPVPLETSDQHGIPGDALEAVAFAVLGRAASRGEVGNVPAVTGARHPVVLGMATPPDAFSRPRG